MPGAPSKLCLGGNARSHPDRVILPGPLARARIDPTARLAPPLIAPRFSRHTNFPRHAFREWLPTLKSANVADRPHRRYSSEMRPLRYSINVTLDGCCDHREMIPDEDLHRNAVENLNQADALLFGRVTYEMMEAAWRPPTPAAARPEARPDWMEPFTRTIDAAKKYVVSSSLGRVDWNAELVRGDLGTAVQQLKQEPGKGLGKGLLVGGVKLPLALAELGLIDEYEFVVHPRLAGHEPTLFAGLSKRIDLRLVSRLEFASGAVAMRYEPRR
jgi:dihydrofolate reductase